MLFSSPPFFVFFVCYFLLHSLAPARLRLPLVILGSTIFYGYWNFAYIGFPYLLLAIAIVGAWWMDGAATPAARKRRLLLTIAALLAPLIFFKYVNFLYRDVFGLFHATDDRLVDVILPLGISFVTFTLIGYAVDVYRYEVPLEKHVPLLIGAVMFFPHLIAGPVVLPRQLIWQFESPRPARKVKHLAALMIFTVGLVKKLVFADQIAQVVNPVFTQDLSWTGLDYLLAMFGFSLQIYCDFSGYSDMAIGLAMLLGVHLPKNFERPYSAASIVEFWQRWHITLSNWLRDYLYIPLGGNRHGMSLQIRNVLITMGLGGLWHGARWTFVAWGLAHGSVIALTHLLRWWGLKNVTRAVPHVVKVALTFLFVTFTWIIFRAQSMSDAARVMRGPFTASWPDVEQFAAAHLFPLILLGVFFLTHHLDNLTRIRWFVRCMPAEFLWPILLMLWALAIAISAGSSAEFIYFDF